jgi:hypothetical protein
MILCAGFNLPFRFVDEGEYNVPYTWLKRRYFTKVHIKKKQNFAESKEVGGMGIETSGGGNVDLSTEEHGIINYTRVLVEFEDDKLDLDLDPIGKFDLLMQINAALKLACVQLLNKLGQIIRVIFQWYTMFTGKESIRDQYSSYIEARILEESTFRTLFSWLAGNIAENAKQELGKTQLMDKLLVGR